MKPFNYFTLIPLYGSCIISTVDPYFLNCLLVFFPFDLMLPSLQGFFKVTVFLTSAFSVFFL